MHTRTWTRTFDCDLKRLHTLQAGTLLESLRCSNCGHVVLCPSNVWYTGTECHSEGERSGHFLAVSTLKAYSTPYDEYQECKLVDFHHISSPVPTVPLCTMCTVFDTWFPTSSPQYLLAYLQSSVPPCLPPVLSTSLPTSSPQYLLAYLQSSVPPCLPPVLSTSLPTPSPQYLLAYLQSSVPPSLPPVLSTSLPTSSPQYLLAYLQSSVPPCLPPVLSTS